MRCAAAAYDILGQLGILVNYNNKKNATKAFYPKLLRKELFEKATENGWLVVQEKGATNRKWEED